MGRRNTGGSAIGMIGKAFSILILLFALAVTAVYLGYLPSPSGETVLSRQMVDMNSLGRTETSTTPVLPDVPEQAEVPSYQPLRYYGKLLSPEEYGIYREITEALMKQEKSLYIGDISEGTLKTICHYVYLDYPEIFWYEGNWSYYYQQGGYSKTDTLRAVTVEFSYTMSSEERERAQLRVDERAGQFIEAAAVCESDYAKVLLCYTKLIQETVYNRNERNQSLYQVFVGGDGVCTGYAKSMQYLLHQMGIDCILVQGEADGESHIWNMVRIDDRYYHLDATWGDMSFVGDYQPSPAYVSYNYFGLTTEEISKTHTIAESLLDEIPPATSRGYNYFVQEGLYFQEYDYATIERLVFDGLRQGAESVAARFSTQEVYEQAREALFEKGGLSMLMRNYQGMVENRDISLRYRGDDAYYIIEFYLDK